MLFSPLSDRSGQPWAAALIIFLIMAGYPHVASGETKAGRQFLTFGMQMTPGLIYDSTHPTDSKLKTASAMGGGTLTFGIQHAAARNLFMSGELDLGVIWLDNHSLSQTGSAESETAATLGAGVLGRWLPRADEGGPEAGFGIHYWRAALDDVPLTVISFDLRAGWYFWPDEFEFLLAEVGYRFPFIQGLALPANYGQDEMDEAREFDAWLHRFSIGFTYGY